MSKEAWTTEEHVASHEGRLAIAEAKIEILRDQLEQTITLLNEKLDKEQ